MNKKIYSILIVIITIISVTFMFIYSNNVYDTSIRSSEVEVKVDSDNSSASKGKNNNNMADASTNQNSKNTNLLQNSAMKNISTDLSKKSINLKNNSDNEKVTNNNQREISSASDNILDTNQTNNSDQKTDSPGYDDSENIDKEKTSSVFKVAADKIQGQLSILDKEKILAISSKLSPVDYAKIKNYLQSDDCEKGVIDTMKLLKQRLTEKDYERIREIANKFLDMDIIENK